MSAGLLAILLLTPAAGAAPENWVELARGPGGIASMDADSLVTEGDLRRVRMRFEHPKMTTVTDLVIDCPAKTLAPSRIAFLNDGKEVMVASYAIPKKKDFEPIKGDVHLRLHQLTCGAPAP
jgi:hypothetical protein